MKQLITRCSSTLTRMLLILMLLVTGSASAWGETVTYNVTTTTAVSTTGTAPQGSSASYSQTYGTAKQMTSGKTTTLTLSGFDGCTITGVTISTKTNASSGAGSFTVSVGGSQIGSLSVSKLGSTYVNKDISVTSTKVGSGETVVIAGSCTTNSLYCESYTITYSASGKTALGTPSNLSSSNVTGSTAELSWGAVSGASSYKVKVGSTEYETNTNSYKVTDLEAVTTYKWSVKALAGTSVTYSDGTYSDEASFTTGAFVATAGTYNVSMNNTLYGVSTGNNATEQSATKKGITIVSGCTSSASSKTYYDTNHIRYYADSYLKLTASTGFKITQVVFTANGTWNSGPSASVGTYTNSTKSWVGSASQVDFSFSDQNRIGSIAVTYALDIPTLSPPTNLQSSSVTATTASLSWDAVANASSYTLKLNGNEVENATSPYSATDLTASTKYTWSVKAIGDGTNYSSSDYATNAQFTTAAEVAAPQITAQPTGAEYIQNATATALTVEASGNPAPTYQWYSNTVNSNENGTEITGETNATYTPNTATAGTFYYYCIATNSEGSAKSNVATITVNALVAPSFTTQPTAAEYIQNATATALSVVASGTPAPTYQWYSNSSNSTEGATAIDGATNASYTPSTATVGTTYYYCVATNSQGNATSNIIAVVVNPIPTYAATFYVNGTQLSTANYKEGAAITFPENDPEAPNEDVVFVGWSENTIDGTTDSKPTLVSSANMGNIAKNFYAVFAKESAGAPVWIRITTLANITEGQYVIKNGSYVLSNEVASSSAPAALAAPTVANSTMTGTVESNMIWVLTSTGTNNQFYVKNPDGKYLYEISNNNGLRVNTTSDKWTFEVNTTGYFAMKGANNSRYCAQYSAGSDWRSYTTATASNYTNSGRLELYKKSAGASTYSDYCTSVETKTLIGIEVTGTPAEFWKGDSFNHNGITVTATWGDETETDVTSECDFSAPDMSTAGQKTVTVTYKDETDSYNIEVKTIENTQATAYTITEAIAKYNAGKDLTSQIYVKGTISQITTAWSDQYNNITYAISEDGNTTSTQFLLYRCVTNGAAVGDDVVAYGTLGIYDGSVQLAADNSIVANTKATTLSIANIAVKKDEKITPVIETNIVGEYVIEYASDNENVVIAADDELTTGDQTGTATITATIAADGYKVATTTFTVTVTSAATLSSIAISGDLTKSTYTVGDSFDFSGLKATGTYSDGSAADLTGTVVWTVDPATLTAATTSVTVKATSGEISGTKVYAVIVNKKTPEITGNSPINNWNLTMGVGDKIRLSFETTPADAEIGLSVTSGSDKVSVEDKTIEGLAVGKAKVKVAYAGNEEYSALEEIINVTVNNEKTATKNGFSTGDNSGSHNFTDNTDISFEAFKGNASTAPAINSSCLRLYQNGGYITISGVKGVKIQSITLTTGSTYASTTVGYCVDDNDAPTTGETVAKSSSYTISNLNNQKVSIYCLGSDKDTRLEIASLEVKYEKESVTLSSIAVSGEYETSFIKNAVFNHTGAVVTATFSDGDKQVVTSSAVFSEPDMTTTGEKTVTVSYTHEGVEKTTSYTINVAEEVVESIALSGEYTKVFKTSDTFSHQGVVVTATYNSGRTAAVEDAVFSTPDLSTTGTKTVTVTYAEKQATYEIKVIPATAVFFESFDGNDGTGGNDDKWSGSIAANDITSDNDGWTFASEKGAKQCAKFGTGSAAGSAKTPSITLSGFAKITFKAAAWNGNSEVTTLNISATSGTLSQPSVEMTKAAWTEYTVYLAGVEESTQITFAASQASNNRFFLDEVLVETAPSNGSLTLVAQSGENYYATFSGDRAVEFVDAIIYTISQNGNNLVLNEVENKQVPANTGVLIKSSDATVQYTYLAAASDLGDNLLYPASKQKSELENHRFYALTYASSKKDKLGFYYINEGGASFKSKDGTAYLAIPKESQISGSRGFSFEDMEDGNETGLKAIVDVVVTEGIYNMEGKKLDIEESDLPKGIYLVNGKKIVKF